MNSLYPPDRKITDVLKSSPFTVSAEIIPPRNGAEQMAVLGQVQSLVGAGAQFLAVTKGAGGSLRGGSLPIAQAIKDKFQVPCIAHFTCRDLIAEEVENSLVDHHLFGIRNILALRGDPPDGQKDWQPKPGGHRFAYELISQIQNMNQGKYLERKSGPTPTSSPEPTDFCIGAAAYPEHPDSHERIEFFKLKVQAGAQFGISDMLFDPGHYGRFIDGLGAAKCTVPILPGTRLLKSKAQADRIMKKFRVSVPSKIFDRLPEKESPDSAKISLDLFHQLVEDLRKVGAPGVHVYVIVDTVGATEAIKSLVRKSL